MGTKKGEGKQEEWGRRKEIERNKKNWETNKGDRGKQEEYWKLRKEIEENRKNWGN